VQVTGKQRHLPMMRVTHHSRKRGLHASFYSWNAMRRSAALLVLLVVNSVAEAQLLDQVDVSARDGNTEIAIRFGTTVQYLRHQPADGGKLLQIAFQLTGDPIAADGRLLSEMRSNPGNKHVPPFEVSYSQRTGYITVKFSRVMAYRVGPGVDPRTILIVVPGVRQTAAVAPVKSPQAKLGTPSKTAPLPTPPIAKSETATSPSAPAATELGTAAVNEAAAVAATSTDVETQAVDALKEARLAMKENRLVAAIDFLNRVLNLPPTRAAQEAQELIGRARELNGESGKARAEYELYLKLYPATPGATRVKQLLANLGSALPNNRASTKSGPTKPEYSYYGSVSSYYYRGSTKYDATLAPQQPGLNFDQISLTATDQSSMVTNIDLNARLRGGNWDHKLVFRDTNSASFLTTQKSYNRINNAYAESLNKGMDLFARVGRQSSPGYGVLGRFDGAWLRYGFNAFSKIDLMAGTPVEFYPSPKKKFFGAAVDLGPFADRWSGNVFLIEQRVEGQGDRRAIGSEIRYLDPQKNGFALLDYDTTGKTLNIALIQGNWQIRDGTSLNLLFDRRRSPILQLTNSLNALPLRTIQENIDSGITVDELRNVARVITPISTLVSVGLTHQVTPAWQVGGDIKYSEVSGTGAIGSQIAQEGTGKVFVYGLQVIRTGVVTINDIIVASTNIIRGKTYNGESFQLSHVLLVGEKWRIESTLKYYHQLDIRENLLDRLSPSVRLSYRWFDRVSIETEAGAERSKSSGPLQTDKTLRRYYNFGMRYDFF
jgi:tetratricopeptide (TPR) repeat protein